MNKSRIALLLTNLIVCPSSADVFNKSQETIYLKAESSARVGQVYKVVDNINVTVDKNFSINTFASLYSSPMDKVQATIEQAIAGGWKDKQFIKNHPDWNELFKLSN